MTMKMIKFREKSELLLLNHKHFGLEGYPYGKSLKYHSNGLLGS